ncbi:hypothetical protein A1O3_04025 [Capronia epimyces CBS 606.96]|uniref:Large ribosomal subunit protein mL53 n=1 Tax=Capronia epimyces CBS 606.96 TaxID=1182542 RepID=W9Y2N2_9EURO|nr:uncharacterized protein A1O3_04025 [Capronia epimyces CBS 606.96]EXJ87067.1 hypothetical protein A1O3_04025 [Capronia epimyces CBS 606.96]
MITTYVTSLKVAFNPFLATSKVPRLFLTLLPPEAHKTIKITTAQFPRTSTASALLELGFKDGKTMKYTWEIESSSAEDKTTKTKKVGLNDIVEEVNRHARGLARKEELTG